MQVLDPIGKSPVTTGGTGGWQVDLRGQTVGVLWNGKPNADNLFRAVTRRLGESYDVAGVLWEDKVAGARGPAFPAGEDMLDRLSSGAIAVLTGSGD